MQQQVKHSVLQLGALTTLFVSIGSLIALLFNIITLAFPDAADTYWMKGVASEGIRFSIALLIVFFPAYLVLTRIVNRARRKDGADYLGLTKLLIYLALLVGGLVILGDLVAVIYTFLNGDTTLRFLLKALAILVVVGEAFGYYVLDLRGYWDKRERYSCMYGIAVSVVVLAVVVVGFFYTETPSEVREMRIDAEQVDDLRDIQWRVQEYYQKHTALPETLDGLSALDTNLTEAPEGREAYIYAVTGENTFELCATFMHPSADNRAYEPYGLPMIEKGFIMNSENWEHYSGKWCFERTIDTDG